MSTLKIAPFLRSIFGRNQFLPERKGDRNAYSDKKEPVKYKVGDTIVHWIYGMGTVVAIEQKDIAGVTQQYYVVEVAPLKLWVPVEEVETSSLRFPTEIGQFQALFDILQTPGGPLPDHHYQRKSFLQDRMQRSSLSGLCHVIRDLSDRSQQHSLNQNDTAVFSRAKNQLLDEWVLAMGTQRLNALQELQALLQDPHL